MRVCVCVQCVRARACLPACLPACLSVCVALASDSSETVEVSIKLGMVPASDMIMHHVSLILTLTVIPGHTRVNHENNKYWIISETVKAIPIKCAVRVKVYIIFAQSDDLACSSLKVTTASQT